MQLYAETVRFASRRVVETMTGLFRLVAEATAKSVAVPTCAACDEVLHAPSVFCAPCAVSVLEAAPWHVDVGNDVMRIDAGASHGGAVATAINRFKHGDRPDLARPLADIVRHHLRRSADLTRAEIMVPVPLHPVRLAERKYNQAALLARELAGELAIPIRFDVLHRVEPTPPQQGLSRAARARNLSAAFHAADVRGMHVLLIDDVATTGATLAACAGALFDAGVAGVSALVVARAELRVVSPRSS